MKPYIVLNKEYNENRPSYVTRIAVSTSYFDSNCIHTDEKIFNFYKEGRYHEIVFVEDAFEHEHFYNLIQRLKKDKDNFERKYRDTVQTLNRLNTTLNL